MVSMPMIKTTDSGHPYVMGIAHDCGVKDCSANSASHEGVDTGFFEKAQNYGRRIKRAMNLDYNDSEIMEYLEMTHTDVHIFETEVAFQTQGEIHG